MWVLTVMLLFYGGEVQAFQFGPYESKVYCQAAGDDALKLRKMGLHVVAAECHRVKEG